MLKRLLANDPPDSDLFRWLHALADLWNADSNYYVFWFTGHGMPRRNYTVRLNKRGEKKVDEMVRSAIRCYKNGQLVDLGKMEEALRNAIEFTKRRPHYSRLSKYEAVPFMAFFKDLLERVDIYGLELTGAGKQALARIRRVGEDHRFLTGNLCHVDELLEELDQLVEGRLLGATDAAKEGIQVTDAVSWLEFYPAIPPFTINLHLDVYVQPAHSKEEWAKSKYRTSDEELGYQQVEPRNTAIKAEGCPSEMDKTTWPELLADQSNRWSTWACCGAPE